MLVANPLTRDWFDTASIYQLDGGGFSPEQSSVDFLSSKQN